MTDFHYIGKDGKHFLITDGIRTKYLTAKEFRAFSRQLFGA
jgi:hypothetical protein